MYAYIISVLKRFVVFKNFEFKKSLQHRMSSGILFIANWYKKCNPHFRLWKQSFTVYFKLLSRIYFTLFTVKYSRIKFQEFISRSSGQHIGSQSEKRLELNIIHNPHNEQHNQHQSSVVFEVLKITAVVVVVIIV